MPTDIRIIHARDFVRATLDGQFDFEASKRLLVEAASAAAPLAGCQIIMDTRRAELTLSMTEIWNLAAELRSVQADHSRKTAVLCPPERFDDASVFEEFASNQGLLVRAFTSFEAAFEWLIDGVRTDGA